MPALMISERVSAVEKIIKYKFHDKALLVEALECPGACICTPHQGNKRLALLGDAALRLTIFESEFGNDSTTGEFFIPRNVSLTF